MVLGEKNDVISGGGGRKGGANKRQSYTIRAGLVFPVTRFRNKMKKLRLASRVGSPAAIYVCAVIEYLCAEIMELAGNACKDNNKKRIIPRHICLAIRNDEELSHLLSDVTIMQGGVLPNVHSVLLPKQTLKKKRQEDGEDNESPKKKKSPKKRPAAKTLPRQPLKAQKSQPLARKSLTKASPSKATKKSIIVKSSLSSYKSSSQRQQQEEEVTDDDEEAEETEIEDAA